MQRGTISLVIILIEGTGNVHSLLPVVTAICVSNFVGNLFGGREVPLSQPLKASTAPGILICYVKIREEMTSHNVHGAVVSAFVLMYQ